MPAPSGKNEVKNAQWYAKKMFCGVLACGLTHTAVVTIDIAKCRSQAHGDSGRWPKGLIPSIRKIAAEEGARGLVKGWQPTLIGYSLQGLFKFGFNEIFKDFYGGLVGGEDSLPTWQKMLLWAAASGSAEVFADLALCPFEMTKVKMQVSLPGDKGAEAVGTKLFPALRYMSKNAVETKFPLGSLFPLWGRQIPYTQIKFVGFYLTQQKVYETLERSTGKKKEDFSKGTQLGITFACGYWAGIFCAISTQPMDNLVSMKGNEANKTKSWGQMAKEMGTKDLFFRGLPARVIMIGTLTGLQWWIYQTASYAIDKAMGKVE